VPTTAGADGLVSCIVPAYNAEAYLHGSLESILAQRYRPIEIVVADDGSMDRTTAIASAFGPPVRVVSQPTAGPAATRNFGLQEARGGFIAFLDPDDLWLPEKLAAQMARFAARPELQCSITHVQAFWDESCPEEEARYREHPRMRPVPGYATTTLLARRAVFDAVGPLDESLWYSDAADWFLRARERGIVIEVLPEPLTLHRLHARNLTRRRADASADEFLNLVKRALDRRRTSGGR
jgi:glycosyltransferase involved in cell wall biosynthesis